MLTTHPLVLTYRGQILYNYLLNSLLAAAELQIRLNGETCHVIATYALLRRKEASPPTLPLGIPSPLGRLGGMSGGASEMVSDAAVDSL